MFIAYLLFQILLLFTTQLSVFTVTTLKSHTEKNSEYCLVCEALLIDIDLRSVMRIFSDNFLDRFDVFPKSGVGGGD